jgi:hypothetical protein
LCSRPLFPEFSDAFGFLRIYVICQPHTDLSLQCHNSHYMPYKEPFVSDSSENIGLGWVSCILPQCLNVRTYLTCMCDWRSVERYSRSSKSPASNSPGEGSTLELYWRIGSSFVLVSYSKRSPPASRNLGYTSRPRVQQQSTI